MEKPAKTKGNKILKYLQRPTSFSIPSAPFSPAARRHKPPHPLSTHTFSGPLVLSAQPARPKSGGYDAAPEPTSPKVSCIGQIKHKKANRSRRKPSSSSAEAAAQPAEGRPPAFRLFQRKVRPGRRSESDARGDERGSKVAPSRAPALAQMRRFASGRETLAGFDWKTAVADSGHESDDGEEEVIIPHSAPIVIGGGKTAATAVEARKEVNLWKRRTMVPPLPLHLD